MTNQQKILETFSEKWKNVECSAHERTSSAACICDSLEDINSDYGYDDIKSFLAQALQETESEGYLRGLEAAREKIVEADKQIGDCYPFLTTENESDKEQMDKYNKLVYFFFHKVMENALEAIERLMKENKTI